MHPPALAGSPQRRVLLVSPVSPEPPLHGVAQRLRLLIHALLEKGHEVHLAHLDFGFVAGTSDTTALDALLPGRWYHLRTSFPWSETRLQSRVLLRLHQRFPRLSFNWSIDDWFPKAATPWLAELAQRVRPDVGIVTYTALSSACWTLRNQGIPALLDTIDVFTDRNHRLRAGGTTTAWYSISRASERRALRRASAVIGIQASESRTFTKLLGGSPPVYTVGHLIPEPAAPPGDPTAHDTILYLGSDAPSNRVALQRFLQEAWPAVRAARPSASLIVGGSIASSIPTTPGVQGVGSVADNHAFLGRGLFFINPELSGTGLKIKSVEALANGRILVATPAGLAGLESTATSPPWIEAPPGEFAGKLIECLGAPAALRDERASRSLAWARDYRRKQFAELEAAIAGTLR